MLLLVVLMPGRAVAALLGQPVVERNSDTTKALPDKVAVPATDDEKADTMAGAEKILGSEVDEKKNAQILEEITKEL